MLAVDNILRSMTRGLGVYSHLRLDSSWRHAAIPVAIALSALGCGCAHPHRSPAPVPPPAATSSPTTGPPSGTTPPVRPPGAKRGGLVGSAWQLERISGSAVVDREHTLVHFESERRVSGSTGCNNFTCEVSLSGNALSFGPPSLTKRGCAVALMEQEQDFVAALAEIRGYALQGDRRLDLLGQDGRPRMRLSRIGE